MLLGFEATSLQNRDDDLLSFVGGVVVVACVGVLGVSVFVLCLLLACLVMMAFVVVVGVCWWGCGVVVWELYSEREHLADEMSLMILFLGLLGV